MEIKTFLIIFHSEFQPRPGEFYIFLEKKILTRSSICIEDKKKKLLVFLKFTVRN